MAAALNIIIIFNISNLKYELNLHSRFSAPANFNSYFRLLFVNYRQDCCLAGLIYDGGPDIT